VGSIGEIVMPQQAVQQGHAAIQGGRASSKSRASSRSSVIGVSVAGALLTAAAIAGVVMMTGSGSAPVTTQVAAVSAPQTPAVAPAMVTAPVAPAQVAAPITNVAPTLAPVAAPMPAPAVSVTTQPLARFAEPAPAPALNVPGQCRIGQLQQLSINLSATKRKEIGNVIRVHSGSYVSPPIVLTPSAQTVTFPAPPGSTDSARIIIEQSNTTGSTFDDEANGITVQFGSTIDAHRDIVVLRWATPRC
jgi:hypothetical protein